MHGTQYDIKDEQIDNEPSRIRAVPITPARAGRRGTNNNGYFSSPSSRQAERPAWDWKHPVAASLVAACRFFKSPLQTAARLVHSLTAAALTCWWFGSSDKMGISREYTK